MATVFMKWLETSPRAYDCGIEILTLGRLGRLKERIAAYVTPGIRVLELGCGTGTLTAMLAGRGATVTGIDASPRMLALARDRIDAFELQDQVTLQQMDATLISERFPAASFDLIVGTLLFSELPGEEQRFVLAACAGLLRPGGRLLIGDETVPERRLARILFYLVRAPLVVLTWLLTRTTTEPLRGFASLISQSGFHWRQAAYYLGGSLVLYDVVPAAVHVAEQKHPRGAAAGTLQHRVTLRTLLIDLWGLLFRILPPYPKVRPGLYAIGQPGSRSPVLVTGNFDLTVRRLVRALDGQADVWLLIADSAGINVWCGAGGGFFTAEKVVAAFKSSALETVVDHRTLILPQLCANGVDGWRVRQETGWEVRWGPVRAEDIPAYLAADAVKTDDMRWVRFPLKDRLEMVTVTLGFYGLLILVPVAVFWRHQFWPVAASLIGLSYLYAATHLSLPGRDGLAKSVSLALLALAGLAAYALLAGPLHVLARAVPVLSLFHWAVGLTGLSVFTAAELQGMSPLMRGEQANWGYEAIVFAVLALIYWLVPLGVGWR